MKLKPIEYLRDLAKRDRKLATGGIVAATWRPTNEAGCTLTIDNSADGRMTERAEPMPSGFVEFSGTVTESEVEEIRQRLQIMPRTRTPRSAPMLCPCVAIYSECRCPDTNISAQTNTAVFPNDQL